MTKCVFNIFNFQNHEMLTNLFGDMSDDDETEEECIELQIQRISKFFACPNAISPLKDLPEDILQSPSLKSLDFDLDKASALQPIDHLPIEGTIRSLQPDESLDVCRSQQQQQQHQQPMHVDDGVEAKQTESNQFIDESRIPEKPLPITAIENVNADSIYQSPDDLPEAVEYFSPTSPKPQDQNAVGQSPLNIPLHTICSNAKPTEAACEPSHYQGDVTAESTLDQIIYDYMPTARDELQACTVKFSTAEGYLLTGLRVAIEKYCVSIEWTRNTVTAVIDQMLDISRQPRHIVNAILEVIEDTKEELSLDFTPPAPSLPQSHQKCLVLVSRLANIIPAFTKYLQFELERKLFTFQLKDHSIPAITNLMHFTVALIDTESPAMDRCNVRALIYKCLYYYKCASIPLVFTVIMAHPHIIPHANAMEHQTDPLVRAIVSVLSNIIYTEHTSSNAELKKTAMFYTLKRRYGFFMDKLFPTAAVVDYCIECLRTNRLLHVDYAIILIAKRQEIEYARDCILEKHLIPMLHQYVSMELNVNVEHDEKICTILFIIGAIVKTFPLEHNITGYLHMFVTCLNATSRQHIQEAAVTAICQMQRFTGTTQIYQHLAGWRPNYPISAHIQVMLKTLVYRKSKAFWFNGKSNGNDDGGDGSNGSNGSTMAIRNTKR